MALLVKNISMFRAGAPGKFFSYVKYSTGAGNAPDSEYSSEAQYPPILSLEEEAVKERERHEWYDKIKRQKTIEEKLLVANMPRRWGWKTFLLKEGNIPLQTKAFVQHITKTHLSETNDLPSFYGNNSEKSGQLAKQLREHVEDTIVYQLEGVRHKHTILNPGDANDEEKISAAVTNALNEVILQELYSESPHLEQFQVDYNPRLEAFWKVGSITETVYKKQNKDGIPLHEVPEEYLSRPSDKWVQYIGNPVIQLRHEDPLPAVVEDVVTNADYEVKQFRYDPHSLGYELSRRHLTNIPGFWPGDDRDFSFMSFHLSNHIKHRPPSYGETDSKEALQCQAILASFGWLMGIASYQGFSSFQDVTYPITTQTVLTDGREFTFAVYQLNTTALYHHDFSRIDRSNLCWITPTMKLFEKIENGRLEGFNEDVLRMLVQFYVNTPQAREEMVKKPYLGGDVKMVADYNHSEKKQWLEKEFKSFSANKPVDIGRVYEVYDWERIYKIDHCQRPRDARRRPFELREQPYWAPMDSRRKRSIRKRDRPDLHLPKYKQKNFEDDFWPQ